MRWLLVILAVLAMGAGCDDQRNDDEGGGDVDGDTDTDVDTEHEEYCEGVIGDCWEDFEYCMVVDDSGYPACHAEMCDCLINEACHQFTDYDC